MPKPIRDSWRPEVPNLVYRILTLNFLVDAADNRRELRPTIGMVGGEYGPMRRCKELPRLLDIHPATVPNPSALHARPYQREQSTSVGRIHRGQGHAGGQREQVSRGHSGTQVRGGSGHERVGGLGDRLMPA